MLAATNLIGFGARRFQFAQSYLTSVAQAGNAAFAGVSFGDEHPNRHIVVVASMDATGIASVGSWGGTIGGISAVNAAATTGTGCAVLIIYARVPTGTSGSIQMNYGAATSIRQVIGVYRIVSANAAPFDFDQPAGGGGATRSATVDTPAGGVAIGVAYSDSSAVNWSTGGADYELAQAGCFGTGARLTTIAPASLTHTAASSRAVAAISWG